MEWKVYELIDQTGQIVYIGMTKRAVLTRFKEHIWEKSNRKYWKNLIGRKDLDWRIISIHTIKKEAQAAEGARKLELGMEWGERSGKGKSWPPGGIGLRAAIAKNPDHQSKAGKSGGKVTANKTRQCIYCSRTINLLNIGRHEAICKLRL
jgi:hypothetical protein